VKLSRNARLDALCGEYLLGTLRGAARRRFERALREEPLVASRLRHWQGLLVPRYSSMIETPPPASAWPRLERELGLSRYRTPWHRRLSLWRGWAIAATAAALLAIGLQILSLKPTNSFAEIAQLSGPGDAARIRAALSADRRTLELRATRPVLAGPSQSYELWLIPAEGGAPVSLAVLGTLDARLPLPAAQAARLTRGAKLAVSVEPAGGSPTGAPTGPVLFAGAIGV
jgi:anti-sigma-K factor RskA